MQLLAIEQELRPIDSGQHRELLRDEAACVWALKKQESIRDIWFTRRGCRAVLMLECEGEAEAKRLLASLPLVRDGFIAFEVMALRSYDGFDRLITDNEKTPNQTKPTVMTVTRGAGRKPRES